MQAIIADSYRLHYPRRPAQYIISVKPARSEAKYCSYFVNLALYTVSHNKIHDILAATRVGHTRRSISAIFDRNVFQEVGK